MSEPPVPQTADLSDLLPASYIAMEKLKDRVYTICRGDIDPLVTLTLADIRTTVCSVPPELRRFEPTSSSATIRLMGHRFLHAEPGLRALMYRVLRVDKPEYRELRHAIVTDGDGWIYEEMPVFLFLQLAVKESVNADFSNLHQYFKRLIRGAEVGFHLGHDWTEPPMTYDFDQWFDIFEPLIGSYFRRKARYFTPAALLLNGLSDTRKVHFRRKYEALTAPQVHELRLKLLIYELKEDIC